jgi:fibronectin type III domain protein
MVMFDADENSQFPQGAAAYAAYVDGGLADQPNYGYITSAFPKANHLSIALFPDNEAEALDIENGAATPESAATWYERQKARGVARPCLYASVSLMESDVVPVITAAGIARESVRLWTAHTEAGEHICGPRTCGMLSVDADGTQWTFSAVVDGEARNLDQSLLRDDFFGTPVPPKPPADWTFGPVRGLEVVSAGPHSVRLSWSSPAVAMPEAVSWYQVVIRKDGQDVESYPRVDPKHVNPETWQGGSLAPGTEYEALVRAVAKGGGHASPWASVMFKTATA